MKRKYLSIPEVFHILSKKKEITDNERNNLNYSETFTKIDPKNTEKTKEEIKKITDLPDKVVVKLIDLKPMTKEEITTILSTYGMIVPEKDLNTLLDYFIGL